MPVADDGDQPMACCKMLEYQQHRSACDVGNEKHPAMLKAMSECYDQ